MKYTRIITVITIPRNPTVLGFRPPEIVGAADSPRVRGRPAAVPLRRENARRGRPSPRPRSSARSLPTSGGAKAPETPRPVASVFRRLLPRPVPKDLRSAVKRPGAGLLPSSPFPSTFDVRVEFGLHTIPSRVYGWRKAAGCGVARGREGSGVGKIDPPPKHNSRPEESSLLDR